VSRDLALRRIHPAAVPAALERARGYRLLNEPEQAESICLDVLAIEPEHQEGLRILIAVLTDQFRTRAGLVERAKARVGQLRAEYERLYFMGLVLEREARAHLHKGLSAGFAHDLFREAIEFYERAEAIRPADNDDPILRRNGCLRTMLAEGLEPMAAGTEEQPLE
jgi:tetratricopeptide (TPR) repeat protein